MRTAHVIILSCAAAILAACDYSPTQPDNRTLSAPDSADRLVLLGTGWTAVPLPFKPMAINDEGFVVGQSSDGQEAVLWHNGTLTVLPHSPGLPGPYAASDITPNGVVVGGANGHIVIWTTPASYPIDIAAGPDGVWPTAINDNLTVVANRCSWGLCRAFKWTPTTGLTPLVVNDSSDSYAGGLNAAGSVSGHFTYIGASSPEGVRWNPNGTPTIYYNHLLCVGNTWNCHYSSVSTAGINDRGDVVVTESGCVTLFTSCFATAQILWREGTYTDLPATDPLGISNSGRVIGYSPWTYYNGALTNLPYSDTQAPVLSDVNSCGTIIGLRAPDYTTGYLWRRGGGLTATCDQAVLKTTR